jgi:hypothetical protein
MVSVCRLSEWLQCILQAKNDQRAEFHLVCWTFPGLDRSSSDHRLSLTAQPLLKLGYASACTVNAVESLSDGYLKDMNTGALSSRLSAQFASVYLLALVPSIHALAEPLHAPSPLAAAFGRLALINLFDCALYALRPLERIGMAQSWKPSLHGMYLVLTYSLVEYSKAVMQVAIPYMS